MLYRKMALRMFVDFLSLSNLAEWTPITAIPLLTGYKSSKDSRSGRMCMQFIQQYVKKSKTTIFPFRLDLKLKDADVFNHSRPEKLEKTLLKGLCHR